MSNRLAKSLAVAYSTVVRYAAEKEMSTLDAMVASAKEGEQAGDALPRKVLADYLEENGLHHDDETLTHLRSEPGEHEHGVNIYRHTNGEHAGKVEAAPHLPEPSNFDEWCSQGEPWEDYSPSDQTDFTQWLGEADEAEAEVRDRIHDRHFRHELHADAATDARGDVSRYAEALRARLNAHLDAEGEHDTTGEPTETESGRYAIHRIGGRYYFAPASHEWNTYNSQTDFSEAYPTAADALDAASRWEQENDNDA